MGPSFAGTTLEPLSARKLVKMGPCPLSLKIPPTVQKSKNESWTLRPCRALRSAARDAVRRTAQVCRRRRGGRHLLPARGGASWHAAQHGAGAGRLSGGGGARDLAHAARAARLSAAALFAAAPDRGNLHARSPQPRPARGRGGARGLAVRAQLPQGRA